MLFKDPVYGEWVEPESFYSFSSDLFYEEEKNIFTNDEGVTLEALKAPVWHGISAVGLRVRTGSETLIFSSDTVNDVELWKQLYSEKRKQRLGMSEKEFESATVIYGDINDYIERIWSEERYKEAIDVYKEGIVIHDISAGESVVHTDYEKLENTLLKKDSVILTHSPDSITSEWVLGELEKSFQIRGNEIFEIVDNNIYPMNADIYHKDGGKYYVGYKNDKGKYTVYDKDGLLSISDGTTEGRGTALFRVDLFEDIAGYYLPELEGDTSVYQKRQNGKVERIEYTEEGSRGTVVEGQRDMLTNTEGKDSNKT